MTRNAISLNEALIAELSERPGVDATNAIEHFRAAQRRVREYLEGRRMSYFGVPVNLDMVMDLDTVDVVMIDASANGHVDLFELNGYPHEGLNAAMRSV